MADGFGIGELSERTGVPVPTLRAWEQRYGVLRPLRTKGGHRRYGGADVQRVSALRALVDDGLTVAAAASRIAEAAPVSSPVGVGLVPAAGGGSPSGSEERAVLLRGSSAGGRPSSAAPDHDGDRAREALVEALRRLLWAGDADEVVAALTGFVVAIGGGVEPVATADAARAIPVDLALGHGEPIVAVADPVGVARLELERLLPALVEDARHALAGLRS